MRTKCAHIREADISRRRHIAREQRDAYIANPERDLYRFSLSDESDKLNFQRVPSSETNQRA